MKVLNYIAILAVLSAGGFASAVAAEATAQPQQTASASSNGISVQTSVNDGQVSVKVDAENKSALVSEDEMLKKILQQTLKSLGKDSVHAKIVNALISAIRSELSDPNAPSEGPISITVAINPDGDAFNSTLAYESKSTKASIDAKSTIDANGDVQTNGKISVASDGKEAQSSDLALATKANGQVSGNVGNSSVVDNSSVSTVAENPATNADAPINIVPDNTIVVSGDRAN